MNDENENVVWCSSCGQMGFSDNPTDDILCDTCHEIEYPEIYDTSNQ